MVLIPITAPLVMVEILLEYASNLLMTMKRYPSMESLGFDVQSVRGGIYSRHS